VREGAVLDAQSTDQNVQGLRRFYELAATDPRVESVALQTVGSKGHDGLAILLVITPG
jgi:predicted O-methyltransferase YrrM